MQNGHAKLLFLDGKILVERADAAMNGFNQAVVNLLVDLVRIHRGLTAAVEMMRAAVEDVGLNLSGIRRGNRVAELVVAVHDVGIMPPCARRDPCWKAESADAHQSAEPFRRFRRGSAQIHIGIGKHM